MARVMGLDLGDRTIGVAISDRDRIIAQGLPTIRRTSLRRDLDALAALVDEHEVDHFVIGWPLLLSGLAGGRVRVTEAFANALTARFDLPIDREDERFTTAMAERTLLEGNVRRKRRRQVEAKLAATLILQGWLDRHTGGE